MQIVGRFDDLEMLLRQPALEMYAGSTKNALGWPIQNARVEHGSRGPCCYDIISAVFAFVAICCDFLVDCNWISDTLSFPAHKP